MLGGPEKSVIHVERTNYFINTAGIFLNYLCSATVYNAGISVYSVRDFNSAELLNFDNF